MTPELANVVMWGILLVAIAAWAGALWFTSVTARGPQAKRESKRFSVDAQLPHSDVLTGEVTIPGVPNELVDRFCAAIAAPGIHELGTLQIVEKTAEGVRLKQTAPTMIRLGEIVVSFTDARNGQCRARYAVQLQNRTWLLWLAWLFVGLGLAAIITAYLLISQFAVNHADPAVRTQAVQAVQTVHFIWPPFLFAGLYRTGRRGVQARLEAILGNLPYAGSGE